MTTVPRIVLALVATSVAAGTLARDSHVGIGSAIVPAFNIRAEALEPGAEVRMLACVTNDNPHSRREIVTGDAFSFTFGGGTVLACESVQVHSSDGTFADGEFACDVDGATVTIRRTGGTEPWPAGDQACAVLRFRAPDRSASVRCAIEVANEGAYAPPMPHYLVLGVGDQLGIVGPEGPAGPQGAAGPQGEQGPPGPSFAGARQMWVSTDRVSARGATPPVLVPGLTGTIDVQQDSNVLVLLDVLAIGCDINWGSAPASTRLLLEVDGEVVASRDFPVDELTPIAFPETDRKSLHLSWLSPPLDAGSHVLAAKVRIMSEALNVWSDCVGSATDDGRQARMVAIELR